MRPKNNVNDSGLKVIVGLGNPGKQYVNTRHNAGFMAVDKLTAEYKSSLKRSLLLRAKIADIYIENQKVILIEPSTFMNNSGLSVKKVLQKYKCEIEDCLIIYDDVSLPLGLMRFRPQGSAGGHNGMASVIDSLGTQNISRLRIGIQGDTIGNVDLADYVLSDFLQQESIIIKDSLKLVLTACRDWILQGSQYVMNVYNQRN